MTRFQKYHGLGNDYLVLNPKDSATLPEKRNVRVICHRNYGIGSDGILYGPLPSEKADFGLRIINPDASEAEKSGNGLRIFARYLHDSGFVTDKPFSVETLGGIVECTINKSSGLISVDMGKVSFNPYDIPVCWDTKETINIPLKVGDRSFQACAANIGNPHCVIPLDEVSEDIAREYGPLIETHKAFPYKTNVQFMKIVSTDTIQIEIWERGAGYTLASGSSSSAAGAVAKKLGLVGEKVTVKMPGGEIELSISDDFEVNMTGPATFVGDFEISSEAIESAPSSL